MPLFFFENSQLRVRSLKPINPGDEITQTYVDFKAGVKTRQELLKSDYFSVCHCKSLVNFKSFRLANYHAS
jgi:hypothetical protein